MERTTRQMALLEVVHLTRKNDESVIVNNVSFSQQRFQKIAIAGETGSGKSTLLRMIAGLVQPTSGHILIDDEKVIGPDDKLVAGQEGVAYLSQHFELPKSLRVEQALTYANLLTDAEADKLYEVCNIGHLLKRRTDQLSGGERQRVALARLLTTAPALLLLDEPFSNLDPIHKATLQSTIAGIQSELGITVLMVSHDPADTLPWAEELIIMKEAQIVQSASPQYLYRQPQDAYVAGLLGKFNLLSEAQRQLLLPVYHTTTFFRPEDFVISSEGRTSNATVTAILFHGSYYDIEVNCLGTSLTVRRQQCDVQIGESVCVSLSPAYIAGLNTP